MNKRLLHGYSACVSYMDANIGRILSALHENGLAENTIVVFCGDHGWKLGDHSSWYKHTNFECDTRVPLMVRAPGFEGSKKTSQLVELIDLYPTLCELTGIKTPDHCCGKSFKSLLSDPNAEHRESAFSTYPAGKKRMGYSIRFGNYRYTEWRPTNGKPADQCVLTDLKADPGEETNVIADSNHADALAKAKELLERRINDALK